MTLGEKLKQLRQQSGLSQSQLAERIYVSRAAVAKWESDLGMPDISNLKALSQFFRCDIALFLDEDMACPQPNETVTGNSNTWCGRSCEACHYQQVLDCPGCKEGPGNPHHCDCSIARCCYGRGQKRCAACPNYGVCSLLTTADSIAQQREQNHRAEEALYDSYYKQAFFIRKWLWIMLFIGIFAELVELLEITPLIKIPAVFQVCSILVQAGVLIHGLILVRITRESDRFKTAGILYIICSGLGCLGLCFENLPPLLALIILPLHYIAIYQESKGFAEILSPFSMELSEKWQYLWRIYKWILCLMVGALVLGRLFSAIAAIGAILLDFIVSIIRFVFLYRTARFYRHRS